MKAFITSVVGLFLAASAGLAAEIDQKDVDIKAPDGINLRGTYYWPVPDKLGPAVLLLPQCPFDRLPWNRLASEIAGAGFHVLTIDFRGHGASGGDRITTPAASAAMLKDKAPGDIDTAYMYLLSQKLVDKPRIGIGGAGCSGGPAADAAARHKEVTALVILSSAVSERGRTYIAQTPALAVFGAMGLTQEVDHEGLEKGLKEAVAASKNPQSTLRTFPNPGFGVVLFRRQPDLLPTIVNWLTAQLR